MAHIEADSGGRKKSLELNLVPFIDLMSVLITFLLLTAVWTQVSLIQIGSSVYGKDTFQNPENRPPQNDVVLKLEIRANGYSLTTGTRIVQIPLRQGVFDTETLTGHLAQFKSQNPTKQTGAIACADALPYERLIDGMDALIKAGFPTIDVLTGGP